MARWEFKLPDIGEGVTEGEIVSWLVKPGDVVKEDEPMVEVMTDKATVTITAPKSGKILETRGKIGEIVEVHGVLVVFDVGDLATAVPAATAVAHGKGNGNGHTNGSTSDGPRRAPNEDGPAATAVGDIRESLPGMGGASAKSGGSGASARGGSAGGASGSVQSYFNDKPLATPATRKIARDHDIDLKRVPPTGPQGRVTKVDVENFLKGGGAGAGASTGAGASAGANAQAHARDPVRIQAPTPAQAALEERVPFAGMRRKIATKMAQSVHTAAHFTFVEECDVTALKALRARMKPAADAQHVKLTYLAFIVKAVVCALKKHPMLNTALDESTSEIVHRKYYNIGIAASTDAGLIVPVVKECDRKSILDVAREIERLSAETKAGKVKAQDLTGSTFTITSLGQQGGLFATPIINFPEVGILGVHQMKEKPVVKDGQIVIGNVMLLSLSFDHRIVDGHIGAAFAYEIISYLESPDKMFLEMA